MTFPTNQGDKRFFNNADSFAMIFDEKWRSYQSRDKSEAISTEEKLEVVFNQIKGHPFLQDFPDQAKEVAKFRLRLLKLE